MCNTSVADKMRTFVKNGNAIQGNERSNLAVTPGGDYAHFPGFTPLAGATQWASSKQQNSVNCEQVRKWMVEFIKQSLMGRQWSEPMGTILSLVIQVRSDMFIYPSATVTGIQSIRIYI